MTKRQSQRNFGTHPFRKGFHFLAGGELELGRQHSVSSLESVAVESRGEPTQLVDRHPFVHRRPLRDASHSLADRQTLITAIESQDLSATRVWIGQPQHNADRRGLPGAIFPE